MKPKDREWKDRILTSSALNNSWYLLLPFSVVSSFFFFLLSFFSMTCVEPGHFHWLMFGSFTWSLLQTFALWVCGRCFGAGSLLCGLYACRLPACCVIYVAAAGASRRGSSHLQKKKKIEDFSCLPPPSSLHVFAPAPWLHPHEPGSDLSLIESLSLLLN